MNRLLRRYWFEFDLPPRAVRPDDRVVLDSQPLAYLRNGVGVTGYTEEDCRRLIEAEIMHGDPLPPVLRVTPDIDVDTIPEFFHRHHQVGVPVWRGVWAPPFNQRGPVEGD